MPKIIKKIKSLPNSTNSTVDSLAKEIIKKRAKIIDDFFKIYIAVNITNLDKLDVRQFIKNTELVTRVEGSLEGMKFIYFFQQKD